MNLNEIRELLKRYFSDRLAEDEAWRVTRDSQPYYWDEDIGLTEKDIYLDALQHLDIEIRQSGRNYVDEAVSVLQKYDISMDVESVGFQYFYREYLKVEMELHYVFATRADSDYRDDVQYLYGKESKFVIHGYIDESDKTSYYEKLGKSRHEQVTAFSDKGGKENRRKADLAYKEFDHCVRTYMQKHTSLVKTTVGPKCAEAVGLERSMRALTTRITKIQQGLV